jgi:GNAT superfamily N-acetyltransferase
MSPRRAARRVEVHPATESRFDDVAAILAPKKQDAPVCWCLNYRVPNAEYNRLRGASRPERLRRFLHDEPAPGVIAYVDGTAAGWCGFGARATLPRLVNSRTIPKIDEEAVWSIICFVIRPPYRREGLSRQLLDGAIGYARACEVPILEAYPVDTAGTHISPTLIYMGTTSLFEAAGFERVQPTSSTAGGSPRWLMRLDVPRP